MHSQSSRGGPVALVLALALLVSACGGSDQIETSKSAGARPAPATASGSGACREAFIKGHERENTGEASSTAFLASIEQCSTLADWTATAKSLGVDLRGREPNFVEMVCAAADPVIQSLVICKEATAELQLRASGS